MARAATLLAFLGAAATSHAATLVSNLDKATNSKNPLNVRVAQQFETGDRTAGYKLDAVELGVERPSGSTRGIQVRLYSTDSSGRPDSRIFTFSGTTVPSGSNNVRFEAPGGTRLDPGTNYFIALRQSGGGGDNLQTRATDNSGQSGLDNWSIANGHYWHSGTSWHSADRAIKMKLLGENAADSPYVTDVARGSSPAGGTWATGQDIRITVTFSEDVDVTGAPRLPLDIGGTTRYATTAAATDTDTVHFDYAVQAADFDADGFEIAKNTLALNGGTIRRANTSVDADLDHPGVSANDEHAVNLILIEEVAMASEAPHGRIYTEGDDIDIGVTFNQPVDVTGTPQLAICVNRSGDDCNEKQADYDRGTGSETLVFRYTVQAGDEDNNGIFIDDDAVSLNGGAITLADDDSRAAILDHSRPGRQDNHRVNALAEIIGSGVAVTSSPRAAPQTYGRGERIEITVTFGAPVNATGSTDFVLSVAGARRAPLLRGSGTNQLVFGYTVQAGDDDDDGIWIGDQDRTLVGNRDGNPQNGAVTSVADATAAMLDHSLVGQLSGHRVDGGRTPPRLSVAGAVGNEGGDLVFTVTLTETVVDELTATWTAWIESGDSAAAEDLGADTTGTVTVPADTTTATFAVATADDATDEFDETFTVTLSDPSTAALAADPTATGTIRDDDAAPTVDIADAEATEGGDLEFAVTLSAESGKPVTWEGAVFYETGDTASGADLGPAALDWTFAPGIVAATTTVATVDDDLDEDAETFTVRAVLVTNATAGDGMATGTIRDNDEPPALSVADGSGAEGSAVAFTVTLSAESGKDVAAEATTSVETGDTATSGTDFTALSRAAVSIPAGDRTATVSVAAATDTVADDGETFTLTLANPTNATVAKATATGTISELPTLLVADAAAVVEGGTAAFGVTLTTAASSGDTATVDEDFTAASGTLTFAVGVTAATTTVATLHDLLDEEDEETFTLTLSNAAPAGSVVLGDPTATGTITDDDDPPVLSVDDVTVGEGDPAVFAVMLTAPSGLPVTVDWATSVAAGDTAEEGVDFTAATSTLVFAPGRTTWMVEVATTADADSDDETFTLTLSELTNATFAGGAATLTATGTIADTPRLDVADVTVDEGGTATFEVTLSRAAPAAVTVDWALSDGTATAGVDFDAGSGTLTFAAGAIRRTVTVTTTPDELDEGDAETFTLTLSNASSNVVLEGGGATHTASGTITDDDDPPELSVDDVTVGEGDPAVFAVELSARSGLPVTVDWATTVESGDSAEADDLTPDSGTLTFTPGATRRTVTAATTLDADNEDETFTLTLSELSNATFDGGGATLRAAGTIADLPRLSVAPGAATSAWEGDPVEIRFRLTRDAPAQVSVDWTAAAGPGDTVELADDLRQTSGRLVIAAGNEQGTLTVPTNPDADADDETFTLTLSNPANATFAGGDATLTVPAKIADADRLAPIVTVDDVVPVESSRGGSVSDLQFRLLCPDCPTAREATQSNSDPVTGVWFDLVARPNERLRVWQEPEDEAAGCAPIVDIPAGEIFAKATQLANFGHPDDPDRWSPRVLSLLVETDEPCNGRVNSYAFAAARYTLELAPWNRSLRAGPAWVVDTRGGIDEFEIVSRPDDPGDGDDPGDTGGTATGGTATGGADTGGADTGGADTGGTSGTSGTSGTGGGTSGTGGGTSGGGSGGGAANRPPVVEREIDDQALDVGEVLELDIQLNFYDRDQRALDYSVVSADASVATVSVDRNALLTIRGVKRGVTAVTVTAADRRDERASDTFAVTVRGPALVALVPRAADPVREGFLRVINHDAEAGEVSIEAVDDTGVRRGPVALSVDAGATVHFNSGDLEDGNAEKGLPEGVGPGEGDWRLVLDSDLDFEVLAYVRTQDGFLTSMHDLAPLRDGRYRVAIFNPGSNPNQVSRLRLVNPGAEDAQVTITGIDDAGASPGTTVGFHLPAGRSTTLTATELESGVGVAGALGDGVGKWRLTVTATGPVVAMSLLSSPTGHLANLSTVPRTPDDEHGVHVAPLFPSASDPLGRQGFVRVVNRAEASGTVSIEAFDDSDLSYPPVTLALDARQTRHFNSDDLEVGNAEKGLAGSTGPGVGDWRLVLSSDLDIEVLAYIRAADGFLTSMHDVAPGLEGVHRVVIFNPGSNPNQVSGLRLVNPGSEDAEVTITGVDDAGASPGSTVALTVPAGASRSLAAAALEAGAEGFDGSLGDGLGKWRLRVESDQPIVAMSLLSSPTGHLTNLSSAPDRGGN